MTIALIIPTLQSGGAERVVSHLSRHFAARQRVAVITWDGRNPAYGLGGELIDLELPAQPSLVGKLRQQRRRIRSLAGALERLHADQAIGFMESANVPLILARRHLNRPLHLTVSIRISPSALGWLESWNMKRLYPRADRIVVQTQAGLTAIVKEWGFAPERCRVIPNPIPESLLVPPPPHSTREAGLIVAVGRLDPQKSFHSLIEAFSRLPPAIASRLVILGDGPLKESLGHRISELAIADRVQLMGQTRDVSQWLDRASLFVLSSRYEGFPNALAEAMARACPIVSTDCRTGPGEMLRHGHSGLLVPVDDQQALESAMIRLLTDRRFASECGDMARSTAEKWNVESIAPLWLP
jgi:GalNAc-alpha-(1->4)-GalNAc-alpha-(1->3)-diNAcBac-PP-undecaprenol alpha-1,4-N-acetyl-D-galactosaminyltransferase